MKNYFVFIKFILFTLLTFTFSCTDPTTLGAELQEDVDVAYSDTLTLHMSTIPEDSVKTFDPDLSSPFRSHLCGNYTDDIMGTTSASIFTQVRPSTTAVPEAFIGADLDSIVLHLSYDSLAFYGDISQTFSFDVYRLTEDLDIGQVYYSNNSFSYDETTPLGTLDFQPVYDSLVLENLNYDPSNSSSSPTFTVAPQLRIPLSTAIGEELLNKDSATLNNIAEFLDDFKGVHIKATSQNNGMLGFLLNTANSGMTVYDHRDTIASSYFFSVNQNAAKTTFIETEFSSEVEAAIDNPTLGDSILFIQGLAGPNIKIDIPYATSFSNTIINKAELVYTVASDEDVDRRTPLQVVAATRDQDGTYIVIDDVIFAINRGTFDVFGGQLEENNGIREYRFNISGVFQTLVDGENESLYLRILPKQEQVTRMSLFGPGHSQYPAKLNLVYTRLPE